MGRKRSDRPSGAGETTDWGSERTLADAEEEDAERERGGDSAASETNCACGSSEFLLEAYLQVVEGRPNPIPLEIESITCPHCGREYEAVQASDGRVLRGEFLGYVELD